MRLLSDICKLRKETCLPHESNSPVYVGLEHIDSGRFFLSRHESPTQVRSAKSRFYPGDVLYGKLRPYLDKAVVAETEGICSTDILVLEPIEVPAWFLCGILHSDAFIERAKQTTHGVNHPRTSWSGIELFETLSLGLLERRKIATVLLKIQRAIETQEKIIQSLRDLKKSTMQHLFTHGLRGEKTKMTEIGEIPESWAESTLGELCKSDGGCIQTGPFGSQLHASDYQSSGVPVVNPTHMLDNRIVHEEVPQISAANANRLSRHVLEEGDILFARRGEIGRHALVTECEAGWLCGTGCFLVRIRDSRVLDAFISWLLYSQPLQDWLLAHAAGAIMPNLNNRILQACPIAFPRTTGEQTEIVGALDGLERKLKLHESKKSVLQDLFKTTLNKLVTGEIRVTDLDIDVREVDYAEQT